MGGSCNFLTISYLEYILFTFCFKSKNYFTGSMMCLICSISKDQDLKVQRSLISLSFRIPNIANLLSHFISSCQKAVLNIIPSESYYPQIHSYFPDISIKLSDQYSNGNTGIIPEHLLQEWEVTFQMNPY